VTKELRARAIVPFLILSAGVSLAEDVVLPKNTVMRGDRGITALKAGTVVEVVARGDKTVTIRYKGQTGTIPLSTLAPKDPSVATPAPAAAKAAPAPAPKSVVADNPQRTYGNLVKNAEKNAAKHEDNLVKPADQAAGDSPSK